MPSSSSRRNFLKAALGGACAAVLTGCDRLSNTQWFPKILGTGEQLNRSAQRSITSRKSMAQEFTEADLSPEFRSNGTDDPDDSAYRALAANQFADWSLRVDGLVNRPSDFTLARLRGMRSRTQITRHDCVEGWSAIGKWTGVPLSDVLAIVQPHTGARYAVFHCADIMDDGARYYESIDLDDGAPLRVRIERQLGYKMAKYIMRIELVESFHTIADGQGGYWEDRGYEWYAGI
jgi:DMSO/TMAO reductase YedYZ molybdopterin-dependent catalytic subunit